MKFLKALTLTKAIIRQEKPTGKVQLIKRTESTQENSGWKLRKKYPIGNNKVDNVHDYRVNYEGYSDDETEDIITYKLTYEGTVQIKTGTTYKIKKTAFYEKVPEPKKTVKEVLMSIGVLILEISLVGVLFIIFFRKGNENKEKIKIKKK